MILYPLAMIFAAFPSWSISKWQSVKLPRLLIFHSDSVTAIKSAQTLTDFMLYILENCCVYFEQWMLLFSFVSLVVTQVASNGVLFFVLFHLLVVILRWISFLTWIRLSFNALTSLEMKNLKIFSLSYPPPPPLCTSFALFFLRSHQLCCFRSCLFNNFVCVMYFVSENVDIHHDSLSIQLKWIHCILTIIEKQARKKKAMIIMITMEGDPPLSHIHNYWCLLDCISIITKYHFSFLLPFCSSCNYRLWFCSFLLCDTHLQYIYSIFL